MVEVNVEFPAKATIEVSEPKIQRVEKYLKGGESFTSDSYTITVPTGKYAKVVVKCIVTELTEEEYNQATASEEPAKV